MKFKEERERELILVSLVEKQKCDILSKKSNIIFQIQASIPTKYYQEMIVSLITNHLREGTTYNVLYLYFIEVSMSI